jgi:hypothetical protein
VLFSTFSSSPPPPGSRVLFYYALTGPHPVTLMSNSYSSLSWDLLALSPATLQQVCLRVTRSGLRYVSFLPRISFLHPTEVSTPNQPSCFDHLHNFWSVTCFMQFMIHPYLHIPFTLIDPQIILSILL